MRPQAIVFHWRKVEVIDSDGVASRRMAMVPAARYENVAKRQFGEEESEHVLEPTSERSMASHRAYFAAINEGFKNLPHSYAARFPSADFLRRWLLIECGWCEEKEFECVSPKHAKALRTFIRTEDAYVRINSHPTIVIVRKAKSQSLAAMGKNDFEASKRDTLDLLESMVNVPKGTLMREGGMSA